MEVEITDDSAVAQMFEKGRQRCARRGKEDGNDTSGRGDTLVMDAGGGKCSTITERAWKITHRTNHVCYLYGYQSKEKSNAQ